MARIVFLSFPEYGHINPTIALIKQLVNAHHEVVYYANQPFKELIEFAGATFGDYQVTLPELKQDGNLVEATNTMFQRSELLYDKMVDELPSLNADLIIHDGVCGWAKCLAAQLKIPAVSSISCFAMNEDIFKGLNNLKDTLKFFASLFFSKAGKEFFGLIGNHNQRLEKAGLPVPPKGRLDLVDFSTSPEKLNIVYATKTWQPQGETFGDDYLFVQPTMTSRPTDVEFSLPETSNKPLIYISMGTMLNKNMDLYKACFEAVADLDVQVILSASDGINALEKIEIPENINIYRSVPQLKVLAEADLFISHGGMNSVNESMSFAVPMILFPVTGEQTLNARTVVAAGAGLMPAKLSATILNQAIVKILGDSCFKQKAQKVSSDFEGGLGVEVAVKAIENYLAA